MKDLANRRWISKLIAALGAIALLGADPGAALADKPPPPQRPGVGVRPGPDAGKTPDKKTPEGTPDKPAEGTPDKPEGTPDKPAEGTPDKPPEVRRIKDTRPTQLPDGVFVGKLQGGGLQGAELRVTIVAGHVTEAFMRRPGGLPVFDLWPVEAGDAIEIRLQGSSGSEFIRINGAFFDAERGAGRFDGVIGRLKTSGTWLLARR